MKFFTPFIALRYLKPKRTFVSFITIISILGVALGVWLLTVVIAVFSGYGKKIKENILGFEPHLEIRAGGYIEDFSPLMEKLQGCDGIVSATPFVLGSVIMEYNGVRNAPIIRAIAPPPEGSLDHSRYTSKLAQRPNPAYDPVNAPNEPEQIPAGEFYLDPYSTVIGDAMAKNLGIEIGSKIQLYSPKDVESIMDALDEMEDGDEKQRQSARERVRSLTVPQEVTVTGIFDSGNWDVDAHLIFLDLETGQVLYNFDLEESHGIAIRTDNAFKANQYKDDLLVRLGMGERKKTEYTAAESANYSFFRWGRLQITFAVIAVLLLLLFPLVRKKKVLHWVPIVGLGLIAVVLAVYWGNSFFQALQSQYYIEQTGKNPHQLLTWMQINKLIFDAIAAERQAMYLILFAVMIVSGFCIMNTMVTVTYQKRPEIGLMKALGARENQIAWLFLLQGLFVGVAGVILGLIIGQLTIWQRNNLANAIGKAFNVDLFSAEVYKVDGGLPASQTPSDLIIISVGALLACAIAAFIPALLASKLQPAKALRSE